ncbi:MAG: lasso peptide biosynthesis B2 protein [Candidatus Competibacteraceae bacterium]|nr:MAG: lasso peptide biosynthesis B2 protein [Candidatus Competibacteraceae bacterium]
MWRTLQRKTLSFLRQPRFTQLWLIPLWLLLGLSKAVIFTVSFRRLAPRLGTAVGVASWVPVLVPAQEARALQIGRAVCLAARYTPWNSNCFPQAVAARLLLGLYHIPYALYFGLMRDPETREFKAHAWIAAGRVRVMGNESFSQFTVVGCFVAPELVRR